MSKRSTETVVIVEGISKRYQIGKINSGSFKRDLQFLWDKNIRRKNPGYLQAKYDSAGQQHWVWALKDINLEIKRGDSLGIIGSNGSGKSTLLKIISRIVKPTSGNIYGKGKICSLLEIGTGFDPALSGRENIFISGSILGMPTADIKKKFDEIVAFSGVSEFIDTPVKRYSSGMYVRLAFSVAAHLEPDILVVDEVLAVGDAEFQKKCLGKLNDASARKEKTILFVSHNMQAVSNICSTAVWLDKGRIAASGNTRSVINQYLGISQQKNWKKVFQSELSAPGNDEIRLVSLEMLPALADGLQPIDVRTEITVKFVFRNFNEGLNLCIGLHLFSASGECIFDISSRPSDIAAGLFEGECVIPGNFLNDGTYYFSLMFVKDCHDILFYYENGISFEVEDYREEFNGYGKWMGFVRPDFKISLQSAEIKTLQPNY